MVVDRSALGASSAKYLCRILFRVVSAVSILLEPCYVNFNAVEWNKLMFGLYTLRPDGAAVGCSRLRLSIITHYKNNLLLFYLYCALSVRSQICHHRFYFIYLIICFILNPFPSVLMITRIIYFIIPDWFYLTSSVFAGNSHRSILWGIFQVVLGLWVISCASWIYQAFG